MLAKVKIQVMQHIVKNAAEKSIYRQIDSYIDVAFNSRLTGTGTPGAEAHK